MKHPVAEQIMKQVRYVELYPGITAPLYARFFKHVADIGSVAGALRSVERIHQIESYFFMLGDYAGVHNALVITLAAYHRAHFSGKHEIAQVYANEIARHLQTTLIAPLAEFSITDAEQIERVTDALLSTVIQNIREAAAERGLDDLSKPISLATLLALIATATTKDDSRRVGYARIIFELGRRVGESNFYKTSPTN